MRRVRASRAEILGSVRESAQGLIAGDSMAFSPDGGTLVVASSAQGEVAVWNVSDRTEPVSAAYRDFGANVALSPTGNLVAVTDYQLLELWSTSAQSGISRIDHRSDDDFGADSVVFGRDGRTIVFARSSRIARWDVSDPADVKNTGEVVVLPDVRSVRSAVFSPDRRVLAVVFRHDPAVSLWRVP